MKFCILLFVNLSFQSPKRNKRDEVGTTEQVSDTRQGFAQIEVQPIAVQKSVLAPNLT